MNLDIYTRVNNNKLPQKHSDEIKKFIEANDGKMINIVIKRAKSKRSDNQNRYYWGVIIPILTEAFKDLGHRINKDECHHVLKSMFNYKDLANQDGEFVAKIGQSTAGLNKTEFIEYIDKIIEWSAEILNIQIPLPNEQTTLNFE